MTPKHAMRAALVLTGLLSISSPVAAQTAAPTWDEARDEAQLKLDMRNAIERDTDVANTALVFNNTSGEDSFVACTAYGANGRVLGRKTAFVPGRGVRYLRASDLSNGRDFVGSAVCAVRVRMAASAVFLAPGALTNLDVLQAGPWDDSQIRFPLIATY